MKRSLILYLTLCLGIGTLLAEGVGTKHVVDCGTWMEIAATAAEDYHFVRWNDNNTDSVRQIQVNEDASYIAFFAANCEEYANLPVVALYDWLLMLDVRTIHEMGYNFSENQVKWFRIVGEPDKLSDSYYQDDIFICSGYYLTIDRNFRGSGSYYAVVDMSSSKDVLCTGWMRSHIVRYAATAAPRRFALTPTNVYSGQELHLRGLFPEERTELYIYDMLGRLLQTITTTGESSFAFPAEQHPGCYNVVVRAGGDAETLRYLVHNR